MTAVTSIDAPPAGAWRSKIDWLSICAPEMSVASPGAFERLSTYDAFIACVTAFLSMEDRSAELSLRASPGAGRGGYPHSVVFDWGARFFYGSPVSPPLLEISGAGCDHLSVSIDLAALAARWSDRVTRIDLAGDIESNVMPAAFVEGTQFRANVARSSHRSATGETEYIGSPASNRRVRVYRYYEPHPRSRFLRVEVCLRRELAKQAAAMLANYSVSSVWRSGCATIPFTHKQWRLGDVDFSPLSTMKNETTAASRLRWLVKVCAPALRSAIDGGLLSLGEFITAVQAD